MHPAIHLSIFHASSLHLGNLPELETRSGLALTFGAWKLMVSTAICPWNQSINDMNHYKPTSSVWFSTRKLLTVTFGHCRVPKKKQVSTNLMWSTCQGVPGFWHGFDALPLQWMGCLTLNLFVGHCWTRNSAKSWLGRPFYPFSPFLARSNHVKPHVGWRCSSIFHWLHHAHQLENPRNLGGSYFICGRWRWWSWISHFDLAMSCYPPIFVSKVWFFSVETKP